MKIQEKNKEALNIFLEKLLLNNKMYEKNYSNYYIYII